MEKTKIKQPNLFKRWYNLAEPNKHLWFWQVFLYIIFAGIYASMTIFAAKTIDSLYNHDWKMAFTWLAVELIDIILRNKFATCSMLFMQNIMGLLEKTSPQKYLIRF